MHLIDIFIQKIASVKYFKAFKIGNEMIDQACRIVMQIGILSKIITDDLRLFTTMLCIKAIKFQN